MKNIKWFAPSLLALCIASTGALKASAHEAQPISGPSLAQDHDQDRWDQPPAEYRDAQQRGFHATAYGVNADDTLDFRPGHRAAKEHRVLAPLLDVGMRKSEIRELSQRANLPTWNRPASACLASRVPYGTEVTPERLSLIERGEAVLRGLGFQQLRVRLHDNDKLARVEIAPEEMPRAFTTEMSAEISTRLKAVGFAYVALDLEGYRQGSLNEALKRPASASPQHNSGPSQA